MKCITNKCRTANERFGASEAVTRPKGSLDFEVLCLVSSSVEAPPAAKPLDVSGKADSAVG